MHDTAYAWQNIVEADKLRDTCCIARADAGDAVSAQLRQEA